MAAVRENQSQGVRGGCVALKMKKKSTKSPKPYFSQKATKMATINCHIVQIY